MRVADLHIRTPPRHPNSDRACPSLANCGEVFRLISRAQYVHFLDYQTATVILSEEERAPRIAHVLAVILPDSSHTKHTQRMFSQIAVPTYIDSDLGFSLCSYHHTHYHTHLHQLPYPTLTIRTALQYDTNPVHRYERFYYTGEGEPYVLEPIAHERLCRAGSSAGAQAPTV